MRYLLLLAAVTLLGISQGNAQGASDGNEYYLGLLYPSYNTISSYSSRYAVVALVSSLEDNTISVSYFNPLTGIEELPTTYTVKAFNSVSIPLDIQKMKSSQTETAEYHSVHIKGKKKISVQYFSTGASSGGAYLGLPVNVLGKKYIVASYNDNPEGTGALIGGEGPSSFDKGCGEFIIIGTTNGTTVTITMRGESEGGMQEGQTRTIALNRGQSYRVRSNCNSSDGDITGSVVESDHPVAVISGHSNASLGGVGVYSIEARDFLIEQMLPVEHWDTTGYASVPFPNTIPSTSDGAGDEIRVTSFDERQHKVTMKQAVGTASFDLLTSRLHPSGKQNVEGGYTFRGTQPIPYMVYQYDQASQGTQKPYPRPSMTQIMPASRYRSMYHISVPQKTFEQEQEDYIYITKPSYNVTIRKNGGPEQAIESSGLKKITTPTHIGTLYQIQPGSYVIKSAHSSFMVYQFGSRRMSDDAFLDDSDGDDNITSYAMPAGVLLPYTDTADMLVAVEELCNGWRVCVTDRRIEGGIAYAVLADDPYGYVFPYDNTKRGPYAYINTAIDNAIDPNSTGEVHFPDKPETVCFTIVVRNTAKDGYAPVYIGDAKGNGKMIELYYKKRVVFFRPDSLMEEYYPSYFGRQPIKQSVDSVVMVINHRISGQNVAIHSVDLRQAKTFRIASTSRNIPTVLLPGDTLRINLRFTPQDTGYYQDTLTIASDCFTKQFTPSGNGMVGLISASDHSFGTCPVGKKECTDTITIWNIGDLPFTLTDSFRLTDTVNFSFDRRVVRIGKNNFPLPVTLQPSTVAKLSICYHPTTQSEHKAELVLQTDIPSPYTSERKNTVKLTGTGISSSSVSKELYLESFTLYPNPTQGEDVTASFELSEPKTLRFTIHDMLGKEMLSLPSSHYASGTQSMTLPTSLLPEGTYILRVWDDALTKSISFRVIK